MNYREFARLVRQLLNRALRENWSKNQLNAEIERLSTLLFKDLNETIVKQVNKEFDFIGSNSSDTKELRTILSELLNQAGADYARTKRGVINDVVDLFSDSIKDNLSFNDIKNNIESLIGTYRNYAGTITRTAYNGIEQVSHFETARKGEMDLYTYAGVPAQREFCQHLLSLAQQGKTWTMAEIKRMDNGQGLPVELYGGGFNCRHFWIPVGKK